MTEIEKMYENAIILCLHPSGFCKYIGATCEKCERHKYPPFTEHKQLELIKFIALKKDIDYIKYYFEVTRQVWVFICVTKKEYIVYGAENEKFEETLAGLVNQLWQDLPEGEKKEIKEILNG